MSRQDLDQVRELDQICEIAARLSEDAAALRNLGFHDTAHLLEGAEADLDSRVYGNGHHRQNGSAAASKNGAAVASKNGATAASKNGATAVSTVDRPRNGKAREVRTH